MTELRKRSKDSRFYGTAQTEPLYADHVQYWGRTEVAGWSLFVAVSVAYAFFRMGDSDPSRGEPGAEARPAQMASQRAYVRAVRAATDLSDPNTTLLMVGDSVCFEIRTEGYRWMRENFAQSTFSPAEQEAIIAAARRHLC